MIADPSSAVVRFRFDFEDLAPPARLRVVAGGAVLPVGAEEVTPLPRPRWLPPLSPAFPSPLRIGVHLRASPVFAALLRDSLAGLFAAAGAEAGIRVVCWPEGMVLATRPVASVPLQNAVLLVPADLTPASLAAAGTISPVGLPPLLLVLNGRLPRLEAAFLARGLVSGEVERTALPLVAAPQLRVAARDRPAAFAGGAFGRACLELARRLVARGREAEE